MRAPIWAELLWMAILLPWALHVCAHASGGDGSARELTGHMRDWSTSPPSLPPDALPAARRLEVRAQHDAHGGARTPSVWQGVDMGYLASIDEGGSKLAFRATASEPPSDALTILKASGVNALRARVWNEPCADGRCDASAYSYGSPAAARKMAMRCKAAGLAFILNLHYSDWWADPGKQHKPEAWAHLPFEQLVSAVHNFTYEVVGVLVAQGTPPVAVQVGNEITNGFLWPSEGESCEDGGQLHREGCDDRDAEWTRFGRLFAAGARAVREVCASCEVAVHSDLGSHIMSDGIAQVIEWHHTFMQHTGGVRIDRYGLSMYPRFDGGTTMEGMRHLGKLAASVHPARVYIAETSYPAEGPEQPLAAYPASADGQRDFLRDMRRVMASVLPVDQNGGLLWWDHRDDCWWSASLFDSALVARCALRAGFFDLDGEACAVAARNKHGWPTDAIVVVAILAALAALACLVAGLAAHLKSKTKTAHSKSKSDSERINPEVNPSEIESLATLS